MIESLKNLLYALMRCYITPLCFEERLYEILGIRIFKKYLPTSGDLMLRHVWKIKMLDSVSSDDLLRYTKHFTIPSELAHLVLFVLFALTLGLAWDDLVANLLINIYPIMLQRYNRARIYRLLKKREQHGREIVSTSTALQLLGSS